MKRNTARAAMVYLNVSPETFHNASVMAFILQKRKRDPLRQNTPNAFAWIVL